MIMSFQCCEIYLIQQTNTPVDKINKLNYIYYRDAYELIMQLAN